MHLYNVQPVYTPFQRYGSRDSILTKTKQLNIYSRVLTGLYTSCAMSCNAYKGNIIAYTKKLRSIHVTYTRTALYRDYVNDFFLTVFVVVNGYTYACIA